MHHETQISFCACRLVCTDCSDRSHPSHIGFVAGNRIHVHLCCYYRAIGVFVYWLTKSTDIESDNRHYSQSPPLTRNPFPLVPSTQPKSLWLTVSLSLACVYKWMDAAAVAAPSCFWSHSGGLCLSPPTQIQQISAKYRGEGRVKRVRERNHRSVHTGYTDRAESLTATRFRRWPRVYIFDVAAYTLRRKRAYTIEFRTPVSRIP